MIDLLDPEESAGGGYRHTDKRLAYDADFLNEVEVTPDAGVSGMTLRTRKVEWSGDYLSDDRFVHTDERDRFVREAGIGSVIAAPLLSGGEVIGTITVYVDRQNAYDEQDAAVLAGLADQAAVAIANVRLIVELERSREETARRADAERTLREIAVRVSSILDPTEVLDRIVVEAARLLDSDGSRIDLWDDETSSLLWAYSAGDAMRDVPDWGRTGGLKPGQAVAGMAFREQRAFMTADYLDDSRFETTPAIEKFIRKAGIRAVIAVPLTGEDQRPLGVLSVVSREPGAYSETDVETLSALATHASIAIVNANLMEALARSQADVERRAEAERTLRSLPGSPPCASRTRSSRRSSTMRVDSSAPTARSSTSTTPTARPSSGRTTPACRRPSARHSSSTACGSDRASPARPSPRSASSTSTTIRPPSSTTTC
jgi:GAF domain-containing protein